MKPAELDAERLRLAAEAADIGTWDYDPVSDTLDWDIRCRELFGISGDCPLTYDGAFLAGLHPEDRERTHLAVRKAIERGVSYDVEYRTIGLADGIERWIAAKGKPLQRGRPHRPLHRHCDGYHRPKKGGAALRDCQQDGLGGRS